MKTSEQLLRNPDVEPTREVIAEGLGAANRAYIEFIKNLKSHDIELEYRYYSDGKSWLGKGLYKWTGIRGGQNEVTVFWLSIWNGFFKITLYIPEKSRIGVLSLPLNEETKKMIEESKQMGKLKFFPLVFDLQSEELLDEVYTLIDFRKKIK